MSYHEVSSDAKGQDWQNNPILPRWCWFHPLWGIIEFHKQPIGRSDSTKTIQFSKKFLREKASFSSNWREVRARNGWAPISARCGAKLWLKEKIIEKRCKFRIETRPGRGSIVLQEKKRCATEVCEQLHGQGRPFFVCCSVKYYRVCCREGIYMRSIYSVTNTTWMQLTHISSLDDIICEGIEDETDTHFKLRIEGPTEEFIFELDHPEWGKKISPL